MATNTKQLPTFESVTQTVRKQIAAMNYGDASPHTFNASDLLAFLYLENDYTLTFSQAADSAAVGIADPDFPYSIVGMNTLESNVYRQIAKASGRSLYLLRQEQEQGWQDPITSVSLPPANATSSTVTSTGSVTVASIIPVTPSQADLLGIVDLQADGLDVTLSQDWLSVSQIAATLSMPSGTTLTAVTGTETAYAGMFKVPNVQTSNLAYYMSQAHRVSEVSMDIGGQSTVQYKFLRGPNIRRVGFIFLTPSGFRDVGNSLGLTSISYNIGNSDTPINLTPRAFVAFQSAAQRRFETPLWMVGDYAEGGTQGPPAIRSAQGMGCYWYDGTLGLQGRDWIRTGNYPSESVNFTFEFAVSCPAGSRLVVVLDRYTSPRSSAV
jgi:hypothetical protein